LIARYGIFKVTKLDVLKSTVRRDENRTKFEQFYTAQNDRGTQ